MAQKSFNCRLITPEAQVLDGAVTAAVVPCWDGQLGILPMRAPMVAKLGIGELRLDFADGAQGKGGSRSYLVEGGFAHMLGDHLTILAERAIPAESISESAAQKELDAAEAKLVSATVPTVVTRLKKERDRAEQRVRAARAFKARGGGI